MAAAAHHIDPVTEPSSSNSQPGTPQTPSEAQFHKRLGQYGITNELLGKGKYAKVYLAVDTRTNTKVAARVSFLDEEDVSEEIRVLRKLHKAFEKPYVVKVFDKFENGKHFIMFMEYCAGGDLQMLLKARVTLPLHNVQRVFTHMATALQCMHALQLVHRDLKPANVMLTSTDLDTAEVRLIDFGFARQGNMMQSVKGSLAYMAPERLTRETYGFEAEVYAIGIILFEMAIGFQPFATATSIHGLYTMQEHFKVPAEHAAKLPRELVDLIEAMLRVEPADRPSISAVLEHPFVKLDLQPKVEAAATPTPALSAQPSTVSVASAATADAGADPGASALRQSRRTSSSSTVDATRYSEFGRAVARVAKALQQPHEQIIVARYAMRLCERVPASAASAATDVRSLCKAVVRDALARIATTAAPAELRPAAAILGREVRHYLMVAGRQEFCGHAHCVLGPVADVYSRAAVLLDVLAVDADVDDDGEIRKLRVKLEGRIAAVHEQQQQQLAVAA